MRQVLVKPDQAPNVTLESQAMRLEIRDQDSVTLPWKADDDFGIERIDMLIAAPGEETPYASGSTRLGPRKRPNGELGPSRPKHT